MTNLYSLNTGEIESYVHIVRDHQTEANRRNHVFINIMETQQSFNFLLADIKLSNRRMRRSNQAHL